MNTKKWEVYGKQSPYLIREVGKYGSWVVSNVASLQTANQIVAEHNAAPELLEALKTVLQLAEAGVIQRNETGKPQWNLTDELQTIAHAAILKAEG